MSANRIHVSEMTYLFSFHIQYYCIEFNYIIYIAETFSDWTWMAGAERISSLLVFLDNDSADSVLGY